MALAPCPHCHRHVRRTEARCPFCQRALETAREPMRRSPAQRLGRAAMAAFGAAAVSTSLGACGARGGLEISVRPAPIDAGVDTGSFVGAYGAPAFRDAALEDDGALGEDAGASHAEYGGPPLEDAGLDAGELVFPAYGGPWFEEDAAVQPDSGLCEDPGCTSADYGGPPEP